jgi:hypothetical protein
MQTEKYLLKYYGEGGRGGCLNFVASHPLHFKELEKIQRGVFKLLRSTGIDSKELIPPAYGAWRAYTTTLFLLGS